MTTKISDIFDAIYTRVSTTLSDHKELYNPYLIGANDKLSLTKGYAILIGECRAGNRVIGCQTSLDRSVSITNTLAIFGQGNNPVTRKSTEKDLFENQFKLIKSFEQDHDLNLLTSNFIFENDGGIEFVFIEDRTDYIMLQSTFTFTYFESLT